MLKAHLESLNPENTYSLCLLSTIGTVGLSALMLLPLLVGVYVDHLGFEEDTAGWISGVNLAGIALMTLIVSLKTKHWPLEKVAGYGLAAMILFDLLSLYFQSIYAFTALRFCSGLAGGAIQSAIAAAIARLAHSDKGYGIYIGFQFLLPAIGFYTLPALLPDIGFNGLMLILVALEFILLLLAPILANYQLPQNTDKTSAETEEFEGRLIMQRPALLSLLGLCVYGAANGAIYAYVERIGVHVGLGNEGTGNVLSAVNVISVLGALLVCWLQDKFGHLRPLSAGIACQIAAMVLLIYSNGTSGYILGVGLWSVAWAFTWPYFLSMQADIDSSGTIVVAGQFTNLAGNSLGPMMAAFLVGGGTYIPAIWLTCALFILSLLPMCFVKVARIPK